MKTKKYVQLLLCAALILLILANACTIVLSVSGLGERPGWLPWSMLAVVNGSMEPELSVGDLVLVQKVPYESLNIGDTVTFIGAGTFVTHRIVGQTPQGYITQGIANEIADQMLMYPDAYCGKVVGAVPHMGFAVQLLGGSPVSLVLLGVLLLMVLYGLPLLRRLCHAEGAGHGIPAATRALVCVAGLSLLLCLPCVTEAKYTAQLKHYESVVASPMYFSSNYLSQEGNRYGVQGWNGEDYTLTIQIRNFNNALLFNDENTDLNYMLGVKIYTDGDYSSDYTVDITAQGQMAQQDKPVDTFGWQEQGIEPKGVYTIQGGENTVHNFTLEVIPHKELEKRTEIYFEVYACTYGSEGYTMNLYAGFLLKVAEQSEFLGQIGIHDLGAMVELSMTTNLVSDDMEERVVLIQWDPSKLYINEFNNQAFHYIHQPDCYDREKGVLYVHLQAYSQVDLEFFKTKEFTDSGDDSIVPSDFRIVVVEKVGDLPADTGTDPQPDSGDDDIGGQP